MDPIRNPFAPGAGNPPPELAGRSLLLDQANVALQRVAINKHSQSLILVGLRGVGKTVLLVKIEENAQALGYRTALIEAHEGKTLPELLIPALRSILIHLSGIEGAKHAARQALRILSSFSKSLTVKINDIEYGINFEPESGVADSGDLEADLPALFLAVGNAAASAKRPVAILVDEMQYLEEREFSSVIMSIHKINQMGLPLILIGAGLPQILGLAGESKSYAERLFKYPSIGALEPGDARRAIVNPIEAEGVKIEKAAIDVILDVTERYPYFLQQWGHDSWNVASDGVITMDDAVSAYPIAISTLDESFFKVRFDRCSPSEKRYMRALAQLGAGAHRSGEVAEEMGLKTTSVGPVRSKLIRKGMIYSPTHGDTAFTVPLFDEYMRRAM